MGFKFFTQFCIDPQVDGCIDYAEKSPWIMEQNIISFLNCLNIQF